MATMESEMGSRDETVNVNIMAYTRKGDKGAGLSLLKMVTINIRLKKESE